MPWSDTLPDIIQGVVPGWFNTAPAAPAKSTTGGWWAGLDVDGMLTVQFVTEAELRILKNMGAVLTVNVNRSLVLIAIRSMAFARGLTVTMDLGLQGVYFLDANMPIGFNRAATLTKVWQMNFSSTITFSPTMALGKVMALGAMNQLWSVNRVAGLDHIVPISGAQTWNVNLADSITAIHTLNFAQSVAVNLVAGLTLIPFKITIQDTFNRTSVSPLSPNWTKRYQSTATTDLRIVGNAGVNVSATSRMVVNSHDTALATADQQVDITISTATSYSSINQIVIGLRGDTTRMGVYCVIPWGSTTSIRNATSWSIGVNGTSFGVPSGASSVSAPTTWNNQEKWRFKAQGDQYTLQRINTSGGVAATYSTWNDTGLVSARTGRLVSIGLNMFSGNTTVFIDQFDATDL